jgi:hypothetical protein
MNDTPVKLLSIFRGGALKRGAVFGLILLGALVAFEVFNFSTTQFALADMLGGNLKFLGIQWATILAIAFCGIDFAGIARLFTPQQGRNEPAEVWYLFGAWLLAAAMNAVLTWWGVSVAIRSHQELSALIVNQATLTKMVPVFVALMVWLIRVLIIGTFSMAGERLFSLGVGKGPIMSTSARPQAYTRPAVAQRPAPERARAYPRPVIEEDEEPLHERPRQAPPRPEPTYHPVGLAARGSRERDSEMR